jgi:hypothetical protein
VQQKGSSSRAAINVWKGIIEEVEEGHR